MKIDGNYIDVVEAAYQLGQSDHDWRQAMADRLVRWLDQGFGVGIFQYRLDAQQRPRNFAAAAAAMASDPQLVIASAASVLSALTTELFQLLHGERHAVTLSEVWRRVPALRDAFASHNTAPEVRDWLSVKGISPDGHGISLGVGLVREESLRPKQRHLLGQIGVHLAAAARLRSTLENGQLPEDKCEAILDGGGRVHMAQREASGPQARERLRAAVLTTDRLRARQHRDAADGIEAWTALVDGRWSLVDRFERDGRRYVVAVVNTPDLAPTRALSDVEQLVARCAALGHSLKLIAYELGLPLSSVATHLRRAMQKLGARSRGELSELALALEQSATPRVNTVPGDSAATRKVN